MTEARARLAILVNTVAPYRVPVYELLGQRFETLVATSGTEANRKAWQGTAGLLVHSSHTRAWGFVVRRTLRRAGEVYDTSHTHVNPGYFGELRRFRPDAVVSTEMGFRSLMALLYCRTSGCPMWIWWGGTPHTERQIGRTSAALRRSFSRRRRIRWISYGQTSTDYLLSLGIARERIAQIQNCVDESLYLSAHAGDLGVEMPRPIALHVGQLIGRKGVEQLLQAAADVQGAGQPFSLALVGSGPSEDRLKAEARSLGLQNVHFLGPRRPPQMPSLYRAADFLVFPTLADVWGLVVNEALWSGLPVLGSRYAGCAPELLPAESTFDPLDHSAFVAALAGAVRGGLPAPDLGRLRTCAQVAGIIGDDVAHVLNPCRSDQV